jgi:hypothetical protein
VTVIFKVSSSLLLTGVVPEQESQVEEDAESQPVGHAGADEWKRYDAISSRRTTPRSGSSPQCLHAHANYAGHERRQLCSNHFPHQLSPHDPKVCRNTSFSRPDHRRKAAVRSPPSFSQPHTHTISDHILRTVSLGTLDNAEPIRLPKSNRDELHKPTSTDQHVLLPQHNQFAGDTPVAATLSCTHHHLAVHHASSHP